jgi:hypothetical protein
MPFDCPEAPLYGPIAQLQTTILLAETTLIRFHGNAYSANSFNPNANKKWKIPEHGARFNPFPDKNSINVPTIYSGNHFAAAALESVFHNVPHVPSPRFLRSGLASWRYSELKLKRDLTLVELTNPNIRQLDVLGRSTSLVEAELIHSLPSDYPQTRAWARYLYLMIPALDGLAWRPRLGGNGLAYVFFGGRTASADLQVLSGAEPVDNGPGFDKIRAVASAASIQIINFT